MMSPAFEFPELKQSFPKVPLCPYKQASVRLFVDGSVKVKQHPSWAKWFKRFSSVEEWCNCHSNQVVGKLIGDSPKDIVYYKYWGHMGQECFNYTFALGGVPKRPLPADAVIYVTCNEWNIARSKKENQHDV